MSDCYELNVAGVTRQLPIIPISPELAIASFVILGDCELVTAAAPLLAQKLPKVDYLVTAEAKGCLLYTSHLFPARKPALRSWHWY